MDEDIRQPLCNVVQGDTDARQGAVLALMPGAATPALAGLGRATLTLLAGGMLAQAVPLLLGPWLTRLYSPEQFGHYTAFAVVAANLAVVACARYEFALPLARDDDEAALLLALCVRVLGLATLVTGVLALGLVLLDGLAHAAWLPLAVAAAGAAQLFTMWATRAQRVHALATARVVQHGGAAAAQGLAGAAHGGSLGLVLGPVAAAAAAAALLLRQPVPAGGWGMLLRAPRGALAAVMRKHREFPLLNTPHAFAGALQDTLAVAVLVAWSGDVAAGFWGVALRYLKAPATLVGGAVAQALYPRLAQCSDPLEARRAVLQVMGVLALAALPLTAGLWLFAPWVFAWAFGAPWREAGELARALALYIGLHFIAAPLSVATLAWRLQGWALRLAAVGQVLFVGALAAGLAWGSLQTAGWCVSLAMAVYFGWFFWRLPQKMKSPRPSDPGHTARA
jgi:O-antigen/teichoic acid export membrane protein